jgi:hypothetical protein
MTYTMWCILAGMALIFFLSLYRYRQSVARKHESRWLSKHHVIDRLRNRLRRDLGKSPPNLRSEV